MFASAIAGQVFGESMALDSCLDDLQPRQKIFRKGAAQFREQEVRNLVSIDHHRQTPDSLSRVKGLEVEHVRGNNEVSHQGSVVTQVSVVVIAEGAAGLQHPMNLSLELRRQPYVVRVQEGEESATRLPYRRVPSRS